MSGATTAKLFFGSHTVPEISLTLERVPLIASRPHGPVHIWTGLFDKPHEDMGNFYTAGKDPIFFGHHANVDRMWMLWKAIGGKNRTEFTDPDLLNAGFVFYDENAQLVRVKVRDCLDHLKLRYKYQDIPIP